MALQHQAQGAVSLFQQNLCEERGYAKSSVWVVFVPLSPQPSVK